MLRRTLASYTPDKRRRELTGELPVFLFYRPVSFLFTQPFALLGISPTAVSLFALAIALSLPLLTLLPAPANISWIGAAAILVEVLDCVDGNLARMFDRCTPVGGYIDMLADRIFTVTLLLTLGIMAEREAHGAEHGVILALLSAALILIGRICEDYVTAAGVANPAAVAADTKLGARDWVVTIFGGLRHLVPLALVPCALLDRLDLLLFACVAQSLVVFVFVQIEIVRALAR